MVDQVSDPFCLPAKLDRIICVHTMFPDQFAGTRFYRKVNSANNATVCRRGLSQSARDILDLSI